MTGVHGLEYPGIVLLRTQFKVRPQGEDPSLSSEVGRSGPLMATGRNPQGLILES